jgi:hypothetical protein
MSDASERSLKSLNLKWLVLLAIADMLIVMFFVAPELLDGASISQVGIGRVLTTTVMPVLVLLVVNVLPHNAKAALVYWKPIGVLPGSEAFTKHAPADPRIDMAALQKNIGPLPASPSEQNAKWFKLYKQVKSEPDVAEAHKLYLLYRDMAVLSLALVILVPISLLWVGATVSAIWLSVGVFVLQYLVTALSSRWSGIRFVCNVLAIHSAH